LLFAGVAWEKVGDWAMAARAYRNAQALNAPLLPAEEVNTRLQRLKVAHLTVYTEAERVPIKIDPSDPFGGHLLEPPKAGSQEK